MHKQCKICGQPVTKFVKSTQQYWDWCSNSCMGQDPEILARKQKTSLEKFGYTHAMKSSQTREKLKQHYIEKYGVDNPSKSAAVKEKIRQTFQEKYGVDNVSKDPEMIKKLQQLAKHRYQNQKSEILDKRRQTLMNSHGVNSNKHFHISPQNIVKYNDLAWIKHQHFDLKKSCHQIATELGVSDTVILHRLKLANIQPNRWSSSESEKQLLDFVKAHYAGEILTNNRKIIQPLELDIVLPELRLALEFNGVFWHSEQRGKSRDYHVTKTQACEQQGIHLIQIYDTEWSNPLTRAIVESKILHLLGQSTRIPARKCRVETLTKTQAKLFLDQNHIQAACMCKHSYGLIHNEQLVAVLTLGQSRFNRQYQWELLRYCALKNHTVIGGMAKLLKAATQDLNISELISYADRRWSSQLSNIYSSTGFQLSSISKPNYKYFQINKTEIKLQSRNKYQKHKLKDLLENFDPALSEFENMSIHDYFRIWDCGNLVYTWRKND